jgi:hypothetical protein
VGDGERSEDQIKGGERGMDKKDRAEEEVEWI